MVNRDDNDTTSISLLEASFTLPNALNIQDQNTPIEDSVYIPPDVIDPIFLNFIIYIPCRLKEIFKKAKDIKMVYKFKDSQFLEIINRKNNQTLFSIYTDEYSRFNFDQDISSNLIFIFGRDDYRKQIKSDNEKEYKNCIKNGVKFNFRDILREKRDFFIKYQIDSGKNIVYILDGDDLYGQIKNIAKIISKNGDYVPKIKTRDENNKNDLMKDVLMMIPGVSLNIANCLCNRFRTFQDIKESLLNHKNILCNLEIADENGKFYRKLGDKIVESLYRAFVCDRKDERIC